jgi:FkbM family methyltransferase
MPIEMPVYVGARLAQWHRSYASLTMRELLGKARRRLTRPLFLAYRQVLVAAFHLRNILKRAAPIPADAGAVSFRLVPKGAVAFDLWSELRFERPELEFILKMLQPGMTFFDIGANVGVFSVAAGKAMPESQGSIYAFEPCPTTFAILEKNLQENELAGVHAQCVAVSERSGEASLYVNAAMKDGLNSLEDPSHGDAEVVATVPVRVTTLDEFIVEHDIPRVEVMKVDVEGAELLVFRGARGLLARADAPLILYEGYSWCTAGFHYHPVEIMWLLETFGYEILVLDAASGRVRQRIPGESYDHMVVAVKPSHPRYAEVAADGAKV